MNSKLATSGFFALAALGLTAGTVDTRRFSPVDYEPGWRAAANAAYKEAHDRFVAEEEAPWKAKEAPLVKAWDAAADGEARIRWTLCTRAEVKVGAEGIVLESGGVRMLVRTDAPDAEYRIWPSDPGAYPESPVGKLEAQRGLAPKDFHFTGFTFTLSAGASADVTTTFRRSNR